MIDSIAAITPSKPTNGIKAVIFDFGGVLMCTTSPPTGRREWEARLGLPPGDLERVVHGSGVWMKCQRGQVSVADYWAEVADRLSITPDQVPQLRADYFRDDQLDPALIGLIGELRRSGYPVGLLSNDSPALEAKLRDELHLYEAFDQVVISAQIGVMKPDPGAYQAIAERLGVLPAACVFIDDVISNCDGAEAVGMRAIHYQARMDVRAALDKLGVTLS